MDIALVSGNPHLPQTVGGVEVNTDELAHALMHRGHRPYVLAKLSLRSPFGLWRAARTSCFGGSVWVDRNLGYPVFRSRRPCEAATALPRPIVAIVQNGPMLEFAAAFARLGVPSVAYLHGLGFEGWPAAAALERSMPFRGYLANSQFTAKRFLRRYGIEPIVVPPLFRRERYLTPLTGEAVTFVNPVAEKGLKLALEIAALCPEIPFRFVRGWPLGLREAAVLKRQLRPLRNVSLHRSTAQMRAVYRNTKILLVPSQEAETWGRVVTEAQFSGIPVVASDRGGLPETVGPGGVVIACGQPAAVWAAAIRELWFDESRYRELALAATQHAARPEIDPDHQMRTLVRTLERLLE